MIDTVPFLYLRRPISVVDPGDSYSNIWKLQLQGDDEPRLMRLLMRSTGRRVRIVGALFAAVTPFDRTPLTLSVRKVMVLPGLRQENPGARRGVGNRVLNARRLSGDPEEPASRQSIVHHSIPSGSTYLP
jgi:hypothetical protein